LIGPAAIAAVVITEARGLLSANVLGALGAILGADAFRVFPTRLVFEERVGINDPDDVGIAAIGEGAIT